MGFLEACVKPEALTAGFKEQGEKGYGLESGLYFIFRRLNSHPPPPTPFWTSVASFLLGCLWVFAAVIYSQGRCCLQEQEEEEEEEEDEEEEEKKPFAIRYSVPELTSISSQNLKFALIARRPCDTHSESEMVVIKE